jgi:hypothetical protein
MNLNPPKVRFLDNRSEARSIAEALVSDLQDATYLDVATGFFEIGGLLELDGHWQGLEKIRILLGAAVGERTRKMLSDKLLPQLERVFRKGLNDERRRHPLLERIRPVAEAMAAGRIECRVHMLKGKKFHAKAFLTGRDHTCQAAQVGSSNFTQPGLVKNTELNSRFTDEASTNQLQDWFDARWEESDEFSDQLSEILQRLVREYTPYEVYIKSALSLLEGRETTSTEWEERESTIFPLLDECQKRGYREVLAKIQKHGGAFLCDGVGMGKTFVGLMLLERFCRLEKKNVALFAPKSVVESVWEVEVPERLPGLARAFGSRLRICKHTDFQKSKEEDIAILEQIREEADVVIIDESHYFRNRGTTGESKGARSRYWHMRDLLENQDGSLKQVVLLTATPINNSLEDFRNQLDLITGDVAKPDSMPAEIGSIPAYLKDLQREIEHAKVDPSHNPLILREKRLFQEVVTQRSRSFAKELQKRDPNARDLLFPEREKPRVAAYSILNVCGALLNRLLLAFDKKNPQLQFSVYYPLQYALGEEDLLEEHRQKQLVGLIRTLFVKRLESSICAFESSCCTMLIKMLAWCRKHVGEDGELETLLRRWEKEYGGVIGVVRDRQFDLWDDKGDAAEASEEDVVPPELMEEILEQYPDKVDIPRLFADVLADMRVLAELLGVVDELDGDQDDKVLKLIELLQSDPDLIGHKVLIFTEFADTARYLEKRLKAEGLQGVESITSRSQKDRRDVVRRFSPFYNGTSSVDLQLKGKTEIEILISTDMLAEGLNLHDATRLINYDIHWNPVQIIQRVGRVDRRLNPEIEERIATERKQRNLKADRGRVVYWNFLPPDELAPLLSLMKTVTGKTMVISKTLGIQTGHLLSPDEELDEIGEITRYEEFLDGAQTVEEKLALVLADLRAKQPQSLEQIENIPDGVLSGKAADPAVSGSVFFCYRLPGRDFEATTSDEVLWNLEAGTTRWYFVTQGMEQPVEDLATILEMIQCESDEPRIIYGSDVHLSELKAVVDAHIKRTYMRSSGVPQGVEPDLIAWMELN